MWAKPAPDDSAALLTSQPPLVHADPRESLGLYADFNDNPFVNTSPLNEQAVDLIEHPRAAHLQLHVTITRPGDIVYIPTRWWHVVHSPPVPHGEPPRRNLAFTVEVSTPPPPGTLPAPPSYVHRPAFSHELLLWAMSHRGGRASNDLELQHGVRSAGSSAASATGKARQTLNDVLIKRSGSCTAPTNSGVGLSV